MTSDSTPGPASADAANEPPTEASERLFAAVLSTDRIQGGVTGLVAGGVATAVMSAARIPVARSPPPPAWFWAEYVAAGDPADYWTPGAVLHLLYGILAGGVFGVLVGRSTDADRSDGPAGSALGRTTLLGTLFGAALSVGGVAVLLRRVLRLDLDRDERIVFHLSHLVYGAALGAWFSRAD